MSKSINLFLKNKNNNENLSKTFKNDFLKGNKGKLNFRKSVNITSYGKGHKKTIEMLRKNFMKNNKDNFDDSNSDNENSASGESKSKFSKKNKTDKKYNLKGLLTSNNDLKNIIKNKMKPTDNNEIDKSNINNNNNDKKNYFKYRRKECKSSTIDASKKISKIYRDFLLKRNNLSNKKRGSLIQNSFNINHLKIYNNLNANKNSITNNNNNNVLNIEPYKRKNIFNNNNKLINKNYLKGSHKLYLLSEQNSLNQNQKNSNIPNINFINKRHTKNNLNLINTSFPSFHQDTDDPKRKSLNLPSIKSDDMKKNINLKTERNSRPVISKSKLVSKTKKKMKDQIPMKKTTTINIYNNKINNINNIILNEKNQLYDNKGEESEFSSILFDSDNLNIKSNMKEKKLNLSEKNEDNNNEDKKNENDYEGLKNDKNSEGMSIPISSSNEKIFKINRNKQKRKKTTILDIKKSNKNYRNKVSDKIDKKLIEKLSINYKNNCLNKSIIFRHRGENMDKEEINIRQKVLNAFSLKDNSTFNKNLKKTKKETTIKLFEELSKNICHDIEEESKNYKNKEKINFDQNVIKKYENDYISKVHKKSIKLVNKMNKFIYLWKNLLIQIYENNISEYSKITSDKSKYLFYKYIFDNYFTYIEKIISLSIPHHKSFKNYNLSIIYNSNINNCSNSFSSSVYKGNENYFHSLFSQYLLMEKDRIQNFSSHDKYLEKVINQINSLIEQAKIEISDMRKTGDVKLNFIIEEKVEDNEIGEGGEQELNPNNNSNNIVKRAETKKFTFMNIQKSELTDTDKYDIKAKNIKKNMFFGKLKFNYKSKILDKDKKVFGDSNIISKSINSSAKSHSLLTKKKTFNNDIFHSHYSNMFNTNSISIDCNSLDTKKETLENKYNMALINREKIERKYDRILTQNIDSFFKRKKNIIAKKKEKHIEIKKNEINFLKGNYMFKNMIDYRTDQIKINIKNNIKSPIEMLFYHIKEHDFDEFVELFERKQIDLSSRNRDYDSFLIYAVKCKAMKFVLYLLKRGINVNLENKLGNTALHYAFSDQNFQLADVLLKHGADEFKTNIYGKTPWQCLGKKKI